MRHQCKRCHTNVSIFWWPLAFAFDCDGKPTNTFELCDLCILDFQKFMEGKK